MMMMMMMPANGAGDSPARRRVHIAVVGSIGAGKSTLIARVACERGEALGLLNEPVTRWQGNGLLAAFYALETRARYAYVFQTRVFRDRLLLHRCLPPSVAVVWWDGHPISDRRVFMQRLVEDGYVGALEKRLYDDEFAEWSRAELGSAIATPDYVVYLRTSVAACRWRGATRDRKEERTFVGDDYLSALEQSLDAMVTDADLACRTIVIDGDQPLDAVVRATLDAVQHRLTADGVVLPPPQLACASVDGGASGPPPPPTDAHKPQT